MDADDCLQNSLVNIFSKIKQFDSKKGNFKNWSCGIVVNENLMFLRKKKNMFEVEELSDVHLSSEVQTKDENFLNPERLTKMLQKLPNGYRAVFNLYVMEGYVHKEIADILNISIGTSKSQLSKARKMLQLQLEVAL